MSRREQILHRAAELFAARGFHGVSVAELGAACGISGPALYKHFPSKDAMLAEMLVRISEELLDEGRRRVEMSADPADALRALVAWHTDFALNHRSLIVVQDRDWESLPGEAREQVRALQRSYVDLWAEQLCRHGGPADRADVRDAEGSMPRAAESVLTMDRARALAHATFGLLNSTPHSALLPDEEMRALLESMALHALGVVPARLGVVPPSI